jgi:hypothetical protein
LKLRNAAWKGSLRAQRCKVDELPVRRRAVPYTESERFELLRQIGAAFWSVFTEEERARSPEFEQEMKERKAKIAEYWNRISEIESSADGWDRLMVDTLRGGIDVSRKEIILALEERGSFADRKLAQFMGLIAVSFGEGFPSQPDPEAKLLMELLLRPSTAN